MGHLKFKILACAVALGNGPIALTPASAQPQSIAFANSSNSRSNMIAIAMPSIVQVLVGAAIDGAMPAEGGNALGDALHREKFDEQGAIGTGFIISSDGIVVTNAHVIGELKGRKMTEPPSLAVRLDDGSTRSATLIGRDTITDLAVDLPPERSLDLM